MGACEFSTRANGKTAQDAFDEAVSQARYEYGHGGYTGTIAEKHSFTLIQVPVDQDPIAFANALLASDDRRVSDKWGPAGCVKVRDGEFYFFGWASS